MRRQIQIEPGVDGGHSTAVDAVTDEDVVGDEHVLGIADDGDVARVLRVRQEIPVVVRLDDAFLFRRLLPVCRLLERDRVLLHEERHDRGVGPRHDLVEVVVLAFAVVDELVSNLHHPVRAALRVRHHEHVLRTRHVTAKRILLPRLRLLPRGYRAEHPDGPAAPLL